ncbi:MAG: BatD family protein [Verrucomicrobiota bacterium]|nr:BatD family protein [Verrucomicrobiota bacterium]
MNLSIKKVYCILALLLTTTIGWAAELKVTAQFSPPVTNLGQRSNYVVVLEGSVSGNVQIAGKIPAVEGLVIGSTPQRSQSSQMQIINGRMTSSVTVSFNFSTQVTREGTYTVPAWVVEVEGTKYTIPAATLQVVPPGETLRGAIVLEIVPKVETLYVGQSLPVKVQLRIRDDIQYQLATFPQMTGDAFTTAQFTQDNGERNRQIIKGVAYDTFTWPLLLTPLKVGKEMLNLQEDLILSLPDQQQRSGQMSNDPFFNRFFNDPMGFGRQERRTIYSGDINIEVKELPTEGKPASFSGAIGMFSLQSKLSGKETTVGEPIILTVTLTGEGNFERIAAPILSEDPNWRIYPPKSDFKPTDTLGFTGTKTFEYILRPESEAAKTIPTLAFSFFEPKDGTYVDLTTKPEAVVVKPGLNVPEISPSMASPSAKHPDGKPALQQTPNLLNISLLADDFGTGLVPFYEQRVFWLAQGTPLLLLGGLIFWNIRRQRLLKDPNLMRFSQARTRAEAAIGQARRSAIAGDAEAFYTGCRQALLSAACKHFPKAMGEETLTWSEIEPVLTKRCADPECLSTAQHVFNAYEARQFAGRPSALPSEPETFLKSITTATKKLLEA